MDNSNKTVWIVGLLLWTIVQTAQATGYLAAAGRIDVSPPPGSYLAGYAPDRKSTGQLDPLYAKAVLVGDGQTRIALVTVDNIGLTRSDIIAIETAVHAVQPDIAVVVSSTHTHAGPDVVGLWGPALYRSGKDPQYMQALVHRTAMLVLNTAEQMQPVQIKVASGRVPMDWVENRSEPGLLDSQMAVLQLVDEQGRVVATLTNYACHPTVLDGGNHLTSADYVAGFYQRMAAAMPGEHLFLQGAIGGWVQPLDSLQADDAYATALAIGAQVADASLALLATSQAGPTEPLAYRAVDFDIPLDNWGFRLLMWLGVLERESIWGPMRTRTSWFRMAGAQFVTHPGETSPAYALASRKLLSGPHTFVLGLTHDALGYILKPDYFHTPDKYPHGDYLTSVSVGEQAGPQLMQAIQSLLAHPANDKD